MREKIIFEQAVLDLKEWDAIVKKYNKYNK